MWGFLQLGVSFSTSSLYSIKVVQTFSVSIFTVAWLMFVAGIIFNFCIVVGPINKILLGLQNVASGNFGYQINDSISGNIGDTIISFNEMSKRLLSYEKKNIVQLISEKARLEALVSTISDGAIILDSELRFLAVNQPAVKALNWLNKDLIGEIIFWHLPVHVNEALLPVLNTMIRTSCLNNKKLKIQELSIDLHHGSIKTFRLLLSTILSYKSIGFNGVVITLQDTTREAQLNGAKSQFISNVSHELRTPLCNIQSFLETLIDYDYKLKPSQKSNFLSIVYAETKRLNTLINDVLDLSKLDSEYTHNLYPVKFMSIVLYIIKTSQIIALNKKVQISIEIGYKVEKVLAHETSLCQVLSNLISNSLKFTHCGGKIIVRMYYLPSLSNPASNINCGTNRVRIEIIDEGIGIEKVYQKQIFDRFMRVENSVHTLKGTGLGLSIVKNIIEKYNSVIRVYSEAGIGTSFWFDLFILD